MVRVQIKGGVWKNTEDEILKAAISKYGMNQWARISSLLVRKTPKQCKARWYEWLDPSIKKTEWSKEEDEKLLHLAKLMPTQWRTIAPIVGRTATQCLERYQKLLDEAEEQDREAGPSKLGLTGVAGPEAGPSAADDVRRLRPGEIDPDPESKPARPDPIDMDEDEKEMLSEARARLANTQGKKAKRKERERALEEAKRLAVLQKRRELKAAGIVMRGPKPKKNEMDYNSDIPFEKQPAKGFYDTSEEAAKSYRAPVGQTLGGKRKPGDDEGHKKKEQRDDKKKADPFGERAEQMRKLKEAEQITKRRKLMLPEAQVGERELEEIVKLGQASESARELVAGDEVTDGLLGTYDPLERAKMARTPRTAPEDDAVMREARNLRNMTAAQTPLLGDLNAPMEEGLGNAGAKPRSSVPQTPNPLLTPAAGRGQAPGETPMSSRGSMVGATPRSGAAYAVDGTPMRTPMRDSLGLNDDAMSSVAVTPFDEKRARFSAKQELQHGLRSLPAPKNDFELVLDEEEEDDDDYEDMITISEDAADRDARMAQTREEERQKALARRSRVVQLDLPRPANVDPAAMLASLRVSEASPAEQLVLREMVQLMKHDSIVHPIAGSKAVGGLRSDLPVLADAALDGAREEIRREMATSLGFPGAKGEVLQRLVASRLEPEEDGSASEDAVALDGYIRAQASARAWSAPLRRWVPRESLTDEEYRAGQAALLELAKAQMGEAATAASREERRLGKLLGGYQSRSRALAGSIREAAAKLGEAGVEQASFERLASGEEGAVRERVARLEEEVRALERREEMGQYRYKELDDRRRALREEVEALKGERDMREAEKINEAALAQADEEEEEEAEEAEVEVAEAAEAPAVDPNGA